VFIFSLLWALIEYSREWFVLGFTWGDLGYGLHESIYILQIAHIFGVYGISFLIVAVNILIFLIIKKTLDNVEINQQNMHARARDFIKERILFVLYGSFLSLARNYATYILIGLFAAVYIYGYTALSSQNNSSQQTLTIALIHPALTTMESASVKGFNKYMTLLNKASEQNPDIIIVPENAFPFFIIEHETLLPLKYESPGLVIKGLYDQLTNISIRNSEISFVIGVHSQKNGRRFNSLGILENGKITGLYNKQVLLPLAENSPKILSKNHIEPLDRGGSDQNITIRGIMATPLICSEIIFPALTRQKNSAFIVNISNDSIFDSHVVGRQNHIMAKFRAVESQKYLVRSVKGGISSIIDPFGRVVQKIDTSHEKILIEKILY